MHTSGNVRGTWVALLAAALAGRATAQHEAWRAHGVSSGPMMGTSVAFLGDVNGDGVADYVTGGPALMLDPFGIGHALVCSGVDGSVLFDLAGAQGAGFGRAVASAGDIDGDGVDDVAIGASRDGMGAVRIHSGATGALLRSLLGTSTTSEFGTSLANLGDVDGDGVDDLAVGAPEHLTGGNKLGLAQLHSGATGSVLASWMGATAGGRFGSVVSDAGDHDGDGIDDLLVLEQADTTSGTPSGTLRIYSSVTFALLRQKGLGAASWGWSAKRAGDVNGDGMEDFIVGNENYPITPSGPATNYYGGVWVYDGATGAVLRSYTTFDHTGRGVCGAGDVDGDGFADYAFELYDASGNRCRIVSAQSGAILAEVPTSKPILALATGVDVGGDGLPDLIAGLPGENTGGVYAGAAWILDPVAAMVLRQTYGTTRFDFLGRTSALLDDVDGDGTRDVLVGVGGLWTYLGRARVLSGVDGSELRVHTGASIDDNYAATVAALPDLDGDSIGEYAIAVTGPQNTNQGRIEIRSGATGNLLQPVPPTSDGSGYFGMSLAVGIQPTGAIELAVGCPGYGGSGATLVYDVATGANVVTAIGGGSSTFLDGYGCSVGWMGDMDGDGTGDWVMGAKSQSAVTVFSGTTGATIRTVAGASGAGFGAAACCVGDVTGDGVPDLFVGAPSTGGPIYSGRAYLYSGATWNQLRTWSGSAAFAELGSSLTPIGDVNRDGAGDVLIGERGTARLVSGATGGILFRFDGVKNGDYFGYETAGVAAPGTTGSMNGDSIPDVAIGATNDSTNGALAGRLSLYFLDDLYLQIDPPTAKAGVTVSATTSGGPPTNLAALYLVAIDGAPTFNFLSFGNFNVQGRWPLSDTIPTGVGGHTYALQSWAIGFNGKLVASQLMELEIQ